MSLTAFTVKGADNASLQIANTSFPATVAYSDLTPVDGSFPTFTSAPVVYVKNANTTRYIAVTSVTTTNFVLSLSSSGGAPGTYTIDIGIETEETPASAPIGTVAKSAPYYCSYYDVKEKFAGLNNSFSSTGTAEATTVRSHILAAYAKINGALAYGGFTVPVTLSQSNLITGALTASDNLVTINLDSGGSYTASDFPVGSTVRVNGFSSSKLYNEFSNVVSIDSTYALKVEYLKNSYDANATLELCTEGFLFLKDCNATGAAAGVLRGLTAKGNVSDANADYLSEIFNDCLEMLKSGDMNLDGLTIPDTGQFIESYQSYNTTADDVTGQPVWKTSTKW